jgi:hypothetical protein
MKRFSQFINENQGIPSVAFEVVLGGEKYYIIANAQNTELQITFTESGEKIDNFTEEDIKNHPDASVTPITEIPPQIMKTLEDMGAIAGKKPEKKKPYVEMGQKELNYQLNIAIDNKDWETAKEISKYIKESLTDKMTSAIDDNLKEIIEVLEENGYVYRGVNIEDEGEWHKQERDNDVMWYIYGADELGFVVKGKERDPKAHYFSITKNSKLPEVKERIDIYKKRYNL